jgi:hypothetical protein
VHPAVPHVVPTAVPHVVPAIPQPIGDECQLPADFILAYGIRATKILTTRQAPGWWVPEHRLAHGKLPVTYMMMLTSLAVHMIRCLPACWTGEPHP